MDPLRQYEIAFVGLKIGVHDFSYTIDDKFFELFSDSLVKEAALEVKLKFDRRNSFFLLDFQIEGKIHLPCDRCGVEINFPVDTEYNVVAKFDEHSDEEKDDSNADVVYIKQNETHFNVAQLIYEFINLSIPINHVTCDNLRGKKPCDQAVLDQLKHQVVDKKNVDHRWDDLTKIKFN